MRPGNTSAGWFRLPAMRSCQAYEKPKGAVPKTSAEKSIFLVFLVRESTGVVTRSGGLKVFRLLSLKRDQGAK